ADPAPGRLRPALHRAGKGAGDRARTPARASRRPPGQCAGRVAGLFVLVQPAAAFRDAALPAGPGTGLRWTGDRAPPARPTSIRRGDAQDPGRPLAPATGLPLAS